MKTKRTFPFKESAVRFGDACRLKLATVCFESNREDECGFTHAKVNLGAGSVVIPVEFCVSRGFKKVKCVTHLGAFCLNITTLVERL